MKIDYKKMRKRRRIYNKETITDDMVIVWLKARGTIPQGSDVTNLYITDFNDRVPSITFNYRTPVKFSFSDAACDKYFYNSCSTNLITYKTLITEIRKGETHAKHRK